MAQTTTKMSRDKIAEKSFQGIDLGNFLFVTFSKLVWKEKFKY